MAVETTTTVGHRIITALFDTDTTAKRAVDDLVAAGIPSQHISRTAGHAAGQGTAADHAGFWESLKSFFIPDEDRHSYAEGLRRGGVLVTVDTEDGNYNRVLDILDTDGAVNLDERESEWRSEGWNSFTDQGDRAEPAGAGVSAVPLDVGARAPAVPAGPGGTSVPRDDGAPAATNWKTDETARAAALDGSVNATLAAARSGIRDTGLDRTRLRSYVLPADSAPEAAGVTGSFSAARDAARIVEHMDVISADGQSIGTVDHLDGPDRIRLAKNTSPDGQHHVVPFAWIDHVDQHVHLNKTLADIKAGV